MRWPWRELLCVLLARGAAQAAQSVPPLVAVVGVRSAASGGVASVEELAARAQAQGIDVLVLAEPYHLSVEYGAPFVRRLVRFERSLPSLPDPVAVARWQAEVERAGALHPDLVLIAGLECAPFYWWNIGPGQQAWTVAGLDQRLVVLGLGSEQVQRLPVTGAPGLRVWHWSGLLLLWPLAGLAYVRVARHRHPRWLRWGVGTVSALCAVGNAPFTVPLWDGHSGDLGAAPYQRFIDEVDAAGGLAVWSCPQPAEPASVALLGHAVQITGRPGSVELMAHTRGWAAFAGLCGARDRAVGPGQAWDQLLAQLASGERDAAVWVVGERGPEGAPGGAGLGEVQTVVWAAARTPAAVLEALAGGRAYARRGPGPALVLEDFVVRTEEAEARSGGRATSRGQATVRARVSAPGRRGERLQVQLLRDGHVVAERRGSAPLDVVLRETAIGPGQLVCYRMLAEGAGAKLVSNPIFVHGEQP